MVQLFSFPSISIVVVSSPLLQGMSEIGLLVDGLGWGPGTPFQPTVPPLAGLTHLASSSLQEPHTAPPPQIPPSPPRLRVGGPPDFSVFCPPPKEISFDSGKPLSSPCAPSDSDS